MAVLRPRSLPGRQCLEVVKDRLFKEQVVGQTQALKRESGFDQNELVASRRIAVEQPEVGSGIADI